MIFAQHGPAWKPKLERFLDNNLIDGIIWDPREENIERISQIRRENQDYSSIQNLVDLKTYYRQFQSSILKRLTKLDYFPEKNIDRAYLRDTENLKELVNKSIDFQEEFDVDIIVSPSFYLYSFNERIVDKLLDTWEIFADQLEDKKNEKSRFVSVIFNETALENKSYISDFLDDFSDISHKFDGIYITIDREKNKHRHDFNPNRLNNMLQFIYDLKNLGKKVVIGYSGIESILYFAVGAYAVGTGWFYSLRNFNREQKGLEPVETMGRQKKRYTSMSMLYELAIEDEIFSIPPHLKKELYEKILTGCQLDTKIKDGNIESINYNDMFQQYFEALNQVVSDIKKRRNIEDKIGFVYQILETAEINIERFNKSETLQKINGKHIDNYKIALNRFKEDNFIFV